MDEPGQRGDPAAHSIQPSSAGLDPFLEAKLRPPPVRPGWVERERLADRLDDATRRPIALVSAPAGYGKTTLAAQWWSTRRGARAAAWVALDAGDNDPARLWTHVAVALERAGCVLPTDVTALMSADSGDLVAGVLPQLVRVLSSIPDDLVILLDDFQCITSPDCHEQVGFLVENLPRQAHLVILSRADPGLRMGRLRASGSLAEIRADALRFTIPEAATLLAVEGVELPDEALTELLLTTEGWPAALYLAVLALSGRTDAEAFVHRFDGKDRFVGEYVSEEVLSGHPEPVRELILRISVLERFCAALCDVVAETTVAAGVLRDLERQNLFLVPLDADGRWFRFHHLFAAVARSQLEVMHPELVPSLHARAADWFRMNGHVDEAVTHLLAAGEPAAAADLVQANLFLYVDGGRTQTVQSWLRALGPAATSRYPSATVAAAWVAGLMGDPGTIARQVDALGPVADHGPLPDQTHSVESALAILQGMFGYDGPIEMMAGARRAVELETDERTLQYAMAQRSLGHAAYVLGDVASAVAPLRRAVRSEGALPLVRLMAMAEQSLVHAELGQHDLSREMAERAMEVADARQMYALPQARSLAFTALGQAQATAGKLSDAMATLEQGAALGRKVPAMGPWPTIHHLVVRSRVAVQAGDQSMARQLSGELVARLGHYSEGTEAMQARVTAVRTALHARTRRDPQEALTAREIDVLRLLQGTLSLTEIAGEIYLTSNTVKTHAKAIYRKLGAHSRRDAVSIAKRRGLL